jgi:hypothetical protein
MLQLAGKIFVSVKGLYIPTRQRLATPRQFYSCSDLRYIALRKGNLPLVPPTVITVGANSQLSPTDVALIESRRLPIKSEKRT